MIKFKTLLKNILIKKIVMVIILILSIFVFFRLAKAFWIKNSELASEIKKIREEIERTPKISSLQASLNSEIKDLSVKVSSFEEGFFKNAEEIFANLNRFAQDSKISLKSIIPQQRIKTEMPQRKDIYFESVTVNIKLDCDYHQLLNFFKKIENSQKSIAVSGFRIQANPQDIWNHNVEINLEAPILIYLKTNE